MEIHFPSQKLLLECLDEVWAQQSGVDILLFQDDLFQRIRRLETLLEGDEAEVTHGFLEDRRGLVWNVPATYGQIWVQLEEEGRGLSLDSLDILEDCICTWAEETIPDELAFFDAALETGHLDDVWADRAKVLIFSGLQRQQPRSVPNAAVPETVHQDRESVHKDREAVHQDREPIVPSSTAETIVVPTAPVVNVQQDTEIVIPEPHHHNRFTRRRTTNILTPSNAKRRIRRTRKSHHTQ